MSASDAPGGGPCEGDPMPAPPIKPGASECCESACERCVFDVYADELDAYRQALARWRARHPDAGPSEAGSG